LLPNVAGTGSGVQKGRITAQEREEHSAAEPQSNFRKVRPGFLTEDREGNEDRKKGIAGSIFFVTLVYFFAYFVVGSGAFGTDKLINLVV